MLRLAIIGALLTCVFGSVPKWQPRLPDHRIVGGEEADISDFPHQLSFRRIDSHFCGASIISSQWALTAAHCIESSLSGFSVSAGSTNRETGIVYNVKRIVTHPSFDSLTFDYDYALLEIDGEIEFGPTVQPIKLAEREIDDGKIVTVTGWGTTAWDDSLSLDLKKVSVPIVSRPKCSRAYLHVNGITNNMVCAGSSDGGKDACQGDSGGPLVADNVLYGIVSWGFGCAKPYYPGVYSNVVAARSWISEVAGV